MLFLFIRAKHRFSISFVCDGNLIAELFVLVACGLRVPYDWSDGSDAVGRVGRVSVDA